MKKPDAWLDQLLHAAYMVQFCQDADRQGKSNFDLGAILGELDWHTELYRLTHGGGKNMNPNEMQVGGQHYRENYAEYQHWDYVAEFNLNYFAAQITKYITRWRKKDGARDVEKAIHYLDKLTWLYENNKFEMPAPRDFHSEQSLVLAGYARTNNLSTLETEIFMFMTYYDCPGDLSYTRHLLETVLAEASKAKKIP